MKHLNRIISLIALLTLFNNSYANNIAAGDVIYEWLSDSTYRVYVNAYVECNGVTEPSSLQLCITNSCSTTVMNVTANKVGTTVLPAPCPSYPTKCTLPASSIPGFKAVVYSANVTLPYRCNAWKFSVTYSTRSASVNIATAAFYAEATLNNTGSYQGNSSPYFTERPIAYSCLNTPFSHNSSSVDVNNDSLVTEIINVKTSSSCGTSSSVTLNSVSPSLSIPGNPFQTNNSTIISPSTGQLSFTPATLGENTCAVRVKEYRGGVLIGTVTRDLRFVVMPCSTLPYTITVSPFFQLINCSITSGGLIACPGTTMSYSVIVAATDTNAKLIVSSNSNIYAGSTMTYVNQNTDSVKLTFTWPVPLSANGMMFNFVYTVTDVTCLAPGIPRYSSYTFPFWVANVGAGSVDTFICQGKSVVLSGGNNWSIISGPAGSLSCTTCTNPVATPTAKTSYLSTVPACPNMRDTVTIDVKPVTAPTISLSTTPATGIKAGDTVTITATTANCTNSVFEWKKNGSIISITGNTYTSSALSNGDVISCQLTCNDTCPNPRTQSQQVTMMISSGIASVINPTDIIVSPNPSNGIFHISTQSGKTEKYNLQIFNNMGQSVHGTQTIILGNGNNKQIDLSHLPAGIYTLKLNEKPYKITLTK
ncbi:MAG: T9SS type A sorting domain-containing protein [Flavipsychrobacter sp.]|nr:T9SS type A sorting domain-containing protein [Flavipsychrobacter sp.]